MKLWEKYLFLKTLKMILSFLFGFYFLYVLIDFSLHSGRLFSYSSVHLFDIFIYYWHHFVIRLHFFLSLSLLFSMVKILCQLNDDRELLALVTTGLSFKKIFLPFGVLSLILCAISFSTLEYAFPKSSESINGFKIAHLRKTHSSQQNLVHELLLDDATKLVYHHYDSETKTFFDVFWIFSFQKFCHMDSLSIFPSHSEGKMVFLFSREKTKNFQKENFYKTKTFSKVFSSDPKILKQFELPSEERSLSSLYLQCKQKNFFSDKEKRLIASQFHYKLSLVLTPLLVFFTIAPFCVKFSRTSKVFWLFFFSLFGWISFYAVMEFFLILGENGILSPCLAIWIPFLFLSTSAIIIFFKPSEQG